MSLEKAIAELNHNLVELNKNINQLLSAEPAAETKPAAKQTKKEPANKKAEKKETPPAEEGVTEELEAEEETTAVGVSVEEVTELAKAIVKSSGRQVLADALEKVGAARISVCEPEQLARLHQILSGADA